MGNLICTPGKELSIYTLDSLICPQFFYIKDTLTQFIAPFCVNNDIVNYALFAETDGVGQKICLAMRAHLPEAKQGCISIPKLEDNVFSVTLNTAFVHFLSDVRRFKLYAPKYHIALCSSDYTEPSALVERKIKL